jgi:hypothetical protein
MKEKSIVLLTGLVTILIIISAGIAGCSSKAPSVSPVTQPVTTPAPVTPAITPIGDPALIELSIGETAINPERQMTVYSASKSRYYTWKDATSTPTYQEKAEDGSAFVIVDAEEKNIGAEYFVSVLPAALILRDSEGTVKYGSTGTTVKTLYKGQSARGIILYTVPENATNFKLSYNFGNASGGPKVAYWSLWFP